MRSGVGAWMIGAGDGAGGAGADGSAADGLGLLRRALIVGVCRGLLGFGLLDGGPIGCEDWES